MTEGADMKILQVVPKPRINAKLKTILKNTERTLRGPHTTFRRMREGRWQHVKYPAGIHWDQAAGGLLVAEIHTKVQDLEWQMMDAFIGYLDRHLGEQIESISVSYRCRPMLSCRTGARSHRSRVADDLQARQEYSLPVLQRGKEVQPGPAASIHTKTIVRFEFGFSCEIADGKGESTAPNRRPERLSTTEAAPPQA